MMYLDSTAIAPLKKKYLSDIKPAVQKNFASAKSFISTAFSGSPAETALFDSTDDLDDSFLTDLLCRPLDQLASSYSWVNDYLSMGKMIYCYKEERDRWKRDACESPPKEPKAACYVRQREEYLERCNADALLSSYSSLWSSIYHPSIKKACSSDKNMKDFLKPFKDLFESWNRALDCFIKYDFITSDLRHDIHSRFGLEVCPYCNRQYITSFENRETKKETVTADLDHFYPQSLFPLFALSLYNLIPSCLVCNRVIKLNRFQDIWNPYKKGFDKNACFQITGAEAITSLTGSNDAFKLNLVNVAPAATDDFRLTDNTLTFFKFHEIYQSHKQYVRELLYKKHAYSEGYLNRLQDIFRYAKIGDADANLILYGHDIDAAKTDRRILGKLTYDLVSSTSPRVSSAIAKTD